LKQILSRFSYKNFENRHDSLHSFASPWPNDEAKEDSQTLAGDLRVTVPLVST
jgi:hypothetical protein